MNQHTLRINNLHPDHNPEIEPASEPELARTIWAAARGAAHRFEPWWNTFAGSQSYDSLKAFAGFVWDAACRGTRGIPTPADDAAFQKWWNTFAASRQP